MSGRSEFSVYQLLADGTTERVRAFVGAEEAVDTFKSLTERPAAQLGIIRRVIITDGGDYTCFEWRYGEGVTFPTREQLADPASAEGP